MGVKIQNIVSVSDVNGVDLIENHEPLLALNHVRPDRLVVFSKAHREEKVGSIEDVWVRESVKELLIRASEALPTGYKLVVWETYTPKALQESIRQTVLQDLTPYSHMTGGAVDVSLADANGVLLDMGTALNHGSPENKSTTYFETLEEDGVTLTSEQQIIRDHRRILYHAMHQAGFTNNPLAWFHWDYGNLWWAKATNQTAFYGPLDI